jgi:hydrogenase/urease accessory protein HupE
VIRALIILLFSTLISGGTSQAQAHALDPGFLEMQPLGGDEWRVTWRKPLVQGRPMPIEAMLPDVCTPARAGEPVFDGRAFTAVWLAHCSEGIAGGRIAIEGLEQTRTDVLVRFALSPETQMQTRRLTPDETAFDIPTEQTRLGVLKSYFLLGLDHILEGIDHLLFVFALLLLVRGPGRIAGAITAFTVAHSITLAAVTFGVFAVPPPPVEAVVALSIAVLAAEIAMRGPDNPGLTERFPWGFAFAFGLLHGLGFASALREIGLPEADVPLALLAFNIGVEAGQLLFIFAVLGVWFVASRLFDLPARLVAPGGRVMVLTAYVIGTVASFWMVERIADFFT